MLPAVCLLLLSGCVGPAINPRFRDEPARIRTIRILVPDFEVGEIGVDGLDLIVGGYQATRPSDRAKPLPEETTEASRVILDEAAGEMEERGFRCLRPMTARERDMDKELQTWCRDIWEGLRGMDRAYLRSGRKAFPPDRGLGSPQPLPGRRQPSDAFLALFGRAQVESRDQRILGTILTGTNKNVVEMTSILVDARTGDLLWRNDAGSPGADATKDWQLRSAVRESLAGFPDSNP